MSYVNLVSYFIRRLYNAIHVLAETIMNLTNCRSFTVNLFMKDNIDFAQP